MVTHTYQHKHLRNIEVAICSPQVDSAFYLWPKVCCGDLQAQKRV